jgi:mono/diheme cytochrome c family protein
MIFRTVWARTYARHRTTLATAIILSFTVLIAGNFGGTPSLAQDAEKLLPHGVTEQMVEQGRAIFHGPGGCFRCHGENGRGSFIAPALNGERHLHLQTGTYQEIMDLIRTGVARPKRYLTTMPPLGGASLTEDGVRAVAAYVFTLTR